ncbi:DUF4350 domain-containing protein [Sphingorhabdus sp.]|jgi:hypothetical protein|uniref:DUF4350 domain-containing protein n=1 Tax=Sphingorhabdus sp. TaxID=1902408 RepID=UPI0037CB670F
MTNLRVRFGGKRRPLLLLLAVALLFLMSLLAYAFTRPAPDGPKQSLGLMTTLPLQWSEGGVEADLADDAKPHPAFARLSQSYYVQPLDDVRDLAEQRLLLLAQPRAFSPAELVQLDSWVRKGGRLLILADPALQWGSLYPLGDKRRPLFTSMLSPLFAHWGLELVLPIADAEPMAIRKIGTLSIRTQTPGEWLKIGRGGSARCTIEEGGLLADCTIGKGRALLVADADLLDTAYWEGRGMRVLTGGDEFGNLTWVESLLARLHESDSISGDFVGHSG